MPLQPIESQRLYQQVARQLRDMIAAGEFRPGERLPAERDLARTLGISRPTVREAMVALDIAGLVEIRTGAGIFVATQNAETGFDAGPGPFDLLAARRLVEGEVAAEAAVKADAAALAVIAAAIDDFERAAAAGQHGNEQDRAFHLGIAAATGNAVLVTLVDGLFRGMFEPLFERLSAQVGLPENQRMTLADHRLIQAALERRDPDAARVAMHRHLNNVEAIVAGPFDLAVVEAGHFPSRPETRHAAS